MGLFRQPGCKVWYMRYSVNGKLYRRSTGTAKKADAEKELRKTKSEIDNGRNPARGDQLTVSDLLQLVIDDYKMRHNKSLNTVIEKMKHIREHFKNRKAKNINRGAIKQYILKRQKAGVNDATINRELAVLRRALRLAGKHGTVEEMRNLRLKEHPKQKDAFRDRAEFEAFREALPKYLHPLVSFAYVTGWRYGTLVNLKWEHVQGIGDRGKDITITAPWEIMENGEPLTVTFRTAHEAARILRVQRHRQNKWKASQPGNPPVEYIFNRDGHRIGDIRHSWNKACQAIGVRGYSRGEGRQITFHSLGNTAITEMLRAGIPAHLIMKIVGHKTPIMVNRYQRLLQNDVKDAFDVMEKRNSGAL